MKRLCLILLFFSSLTLTENAWAETDIKTMFQWVCREMKVDHNFSLVPELPEIIEMPERDFYSLVSKFSVIRRSFGNKVDSIVAIYQPRENKIYLIKGTPERYLVHELVHFVQFKIKKIFPEEADFKDVATRRIIKELEIEARLLELHWEKNRERAQD